MPESAIPACTIREAISMPHQPIREAPSACTISEASMHNQGCHQEGHQRRHQRGHQGGHQGDLRQPISTQPERNQHAISTQSARNQHAISTQSARNQHTISTQSARNQHTISTQSARNQHAIPHTSPRPRCTRRPRRGRERSCDSCHRRSRYRRRSRAPPRNWA